MHDWDDLRWLLAVLRAGSASRAAADLGTSTTTVTRRLAGVEERLDTVLFARRPEGLVPTPAALALRPVAEAAEQAALAVSGTLAALLEAPAGVVKLTMPQEVADRIVLPVLGDFLDAHPGLSLDLDLSVGLLDLRRQEADIAVRTVRPDHGDQLVVSRLRDTAFGVYGTVERVGDGDPERLKREAPWIRWGGVHNPIAAFYDEVQVVRLVVPALSSVRAAAEAGVGLALLPTAIGTCAPRLVRVPFPDLPAGGPLWIVGHTASRDVPRVRAVWRFLEEVFRPVEGRDEDALLRARAAAAYGLSFPPAR
jgi:DNA-binding transcriptional LysR family regulator